MGVSFDPYKDAKTLLDKTFVIRFKISKNIF